LTATTSSGFTQCTRESRSGDPKLLVFGGGWVNGIFLSARKGANEANFVKILSFWITDFCSYQAQKWTQDKQINSVFT
jgi:hypothetical protein